MISPVGRAPAVPLVVAAARPFGGRSRSTADSGTGSAAQFEDHREQCFAAAYRMLGSVADAEDVVQETWLRWSCRDRSEVTTPGAYLVRTATRLALDRLRALRARRESYVGQWLPEPVITAQAGEDAAEPALRSESASAAVLVVLEALAPAERAVFVLREVFGFPREEIAATLGRSTAGVRQLAHRAREHVRARRPRFDADRETRRRVAERFLDACRGGDLTALLAELAPEVALGGGRAKSARNPVRGADEVARFLAGIHANRFHRREFRLVELNGQPGAIRRRGRRGDHRRRRRRGRAAGRAGGQPGRADRPGRRRGSSPGAVTRPRGRTSAGPAGPTPGSSALLPRL
ncbi:RNA polymerase sigma factor SigJ [Salinifilum ghardaiensis]